MIDFQNFAQIIYLHDINEYMKIFDIVEKVKAYAHEKNLETIEIDGVRINYEDGWALIRSSNTGPNLTLRFEFTTEERLNEVKEEFINLVNSLK